MQSKRTANTSLGQRAIRLFVGLMSASMLWACANIGMPEGEPFDTTPPRLVSANPSPKALEVKGKRVELHFDEFIKLNQQDKIIISPAQLQQPLIEARGKSISIKLLDSLRPNTTYSIYFDDVVVDNNEDNPLENFAYSFSTGNSIDSMQLGGLVLDAETLEPVGDVILGAYWADDKRDSIALQERFAFSSKTSKQGRFTIRGLRDSLYSVYALKDNDNDYKFDGVSEGFAFLKAKSFRTTKLDSVKTDTIKIDSIVRRDTLYRDSLVTYKHTYYSPDDVVLRYFTPKSKQRGLQRSARLDSLRLELNFYEELGETPQLRSLDKPSLGQERLFDTSRSGSTVIYWLRDRELMAMDSIRFTLSYVKTDSLLRELQKTDTLTFYKPRAKKGEGKNKNEGEGKDNPFKLSLRGSRGILSSTPLDSLILSATYPIEGLSTQQMTLEASRDTSYTPQPFTIEQDSTDILNYHIRFERKYGVKYRLRIDSAAVASIYGHKAGAVQTEQTISDDKEFGGLKLSIEGISGRAFVQLLAKDGSPMLTREALALTDSLSSADSTKVLPKSTAPSRLEVSFPDLKPDDYYLRMYVDEDGDGKWTTGDYPSREPEMMYYSPSKYPVKKGFTTTESWRPLATPITRQKPLELLKNKPEAKRRREDKNKEYQKRMDEKKAKR